MRAEDNLQMPELITTEYEVEMSGKEKEKYKTMKNDLIVKLGGKEITAANAASLCGKLCQMANGAIYDDDKNIINILGQSLTHLRT